MSNKSLYLVKINYETTNKNEIINNEIDYILLQENSEEEVYIKLKNIKQDDVLWLKTKWSNSCNIDKKILKITVEKIEKDIIIFTEL